MANYESLYNGKETPPRARKGVHSKRQRRRTQTKAVWLKTEILGAPVCDGSHTMESTDVLEVHEPKTWAWVGVGEGGIPHFM